MLTADQIRDITFASGFNGYKAGEVDAFLDNCADTVAALTEANEELKKKIKILADKLVEYRNEESSIHSALMSAQRMGDSVVREANQKATLILDDARAKAEKILEKANSEIQGKKEELSNLENEVALFKNRLLALYKEHLVMIQQLPEPAEAEEPETAEPAAEEQPEPVAAPVRPAEEPEQPAEPAEAEEPEQITLDQVPAEPLMWSEPEEAEEPQLEPAEETGSEEERGDSRFADLQFGDDYPAAGNSRGFFNRKK